MAGYGFNEISFINNSDDSPSVTTVKGTGAECSLIINFGLYCQQ